MKQLFSFLLSFFLVGTAVKAQNIGEYFYGSNNADFIQTTLIENDSITVTIGAKTNPSSSLYEVWFQKLNIKTMKPVFEKVFSNNATTYGEVGYCIIKSSSGGYLIGGRKVFGNFNEGQGLIIKTDADAEIEWKKDYTEYDAVYGLKEDSDGKYFACGFTQFAVPAEAKLMKIGKTGDIKWEQSYGDLTQTVFKHIYSTADDKLLLLGRTSVNAVGFAGIFIVKAEKDGTIIWQKQYDTQFDEDNLGYNIDHMIPLGVTPLADGGFLMVNPQDYYSMTEVLRIDKEGNLVWKKTIPTTNPKDYPFAIKLLADNNMLICGEKKGDKGSQGFVMVVNEAGKTLQRINLGNEAGESRFLTCDVAKNGNFMLYGMSSKTNDLKEQEAWVVVMDPNGYSSPYRIKTKVVLDANNNCQNEVSEKTLEGWFVKTSASGTPFLVSDGNGAAIMENKKDTTLLELVNPNKDVYSLCTAKQQVIKNANAPIQEITFLVQYKDNCPKPEISITQPELVPCNPNRYIVTVQNLGNSDSEDLSATITLDKHLTLISCSKLYTKQGNTLTFALNKVEKNTAQHIEIVTRLACTAQLGTTHLVTAELLPLECVAPWTKAKIQLDYTCDAKNITFFCKNIGNVATEKPLKYTVWKNQYILQSNELQLNAGSSETLVFPADGNTYHIECAQPEGFPYNRTASLTVEGCNIKATGLYTVGFGDAFGSSDAQPSRSHALAMNGTGLPNKIEELSGKMGSNHFISTKDALEYCVRARNNTGKMQDSIEFELFPSVALDVSTLQIIGSNTTPILTVDRVGSIKIKMKGLGLSNYAADSIHADAAVRFRIYPASWSKPNTYYDSSTFLITGNAFFNALQKTTLVSAWQKYATNNQYTLQKKYEYPSNVQTYGGKYTDFSSNVVATSDGNVLLTGVTSSYNGNRGYEVFLIKTTKTGKVLWQKIDSWGEGLSYLQRTLVAKDGSIFLLGSYLPKDSTGTTSAYEVVVEKMDKNGKRIWIKNYKPGVGGNGGWGEDLIFTSDGNLLVSGRSNNGGNAIDNYLLKIDLNGTILWKQNYVVTGIAFYGQHVTEVKDGAFIITGDEGSTNSYPIYYQKVDKNGNELWVRNYTPPTDSARFSYVSSIVEPDESVLFLGESQWQLPNKDYAITPFLIKFDKNGNKVFEKRPILGKERVFWPRGMTKRNDNEHYIYGEYYVDTINHGDIGIARFDKNFNLTWLNNYGATTTEWADEGLLIAPDTMLLWGFHQRTLGDNDLNCVLVVADMKGTGVFTNENIEKKNLQVQCVPNPTADYLTISSSNWLEFSTTVGVLEIHDLLGKEWLKTKFDATTSNTIDVRSLSNGVYTYAIRIKGEVVYANKFVVLK